MPDLWLWSHRLVSTGACVCIYFRNLSCRSLCLGLLCWRPGGSRPPRFSGPIGFVPHGAFFFGSHRRPRLEIVAQRRGHHQLAGRPPWFAWLMLSIPPAVEKAGHLLGQANKLTCLRNGEARRP